MAVKQRNQPSSQGGRGNNQSQLIHRAIPIEGREQGGSNKGQGKEAHNNGILTIVDL